MKDLTNKAFLDAIRTGEYTQWDQSDFKSELCRPGRIDGLRPHVNGKDLDLVRRFVRSDDPDEVLIAHVLGRKLIREMAAAIVPDFRAAYERWRSGGNLFLAVSLFHDLAEQANFLAAEREGFATMVQTHRPDMKRVIYSFVGDDAGLLRVFSDRLKDVFSDNPQTLNSPDKAFMYVLYLGLIDDPALVAETVNVLEQYQDKGDSFFQTVTRQELLRLRDRR